MLIKSLSFRKKTYVSHRVVIGLIMGWALMIGCKNEENTEVKNKPNILFIITDDQRADALGAAGNTSIETPNIDRIAKQGILFNNAYIMGANHGAVCAPSRAMLMSGLGLNHVYEDLGAMTIADWERDSMIGVFRPFHNALDNKLIFPQWLREVNYTTFATGKWHSSRKSFLYLFSVFRALSEHGSDGFHLTSNVAREHLNLLNKLQRYRI